MTYTLCVPLARGIFPNNMKAELGLRLRGRGVFMHILGYNIAFTRNAEPYKNSIVHIINRIGTSNEGKLLFKKFKFNSISPLGSFGNGITNAKK
jgi:hypothetical protein